MATLADLPQIIGRALRTGGNVHIVGTPGLGKTSVLEQIAAKQREADPDFWFEVLYTPSLSPLDFIMAMPHQESGTLKMYRNERLPNAHVTPDLCGILFLGERDNADPATNKALQKYVNNEDMGGLKKPKGVIVVSDSNDIRHRSGAMQQSLALLSRSMVVQVDIDYDVTLAYFSAIDVNPYVQAYLSLRKEHVDTFESVLKNKSYEVWANPRAWERVGRLYDDADAHGSHISADEVIGNVGEGVGREFLAFLESAKLVSYEDIVNNPKRAEQPPILGDVYAVIAMLATTTKPEHMQSVKDYVCRWPHEVQILFLRLFTRGKSQNRIACCQTKAYIEWFNDSVLRDAIVG